VSILGLNELANPYLTILPIILMVFSSHAVGIIIYKIRRKTSPAPLRDFIYGSITLNFLFLSGFIIFGVLTYSASGYFTAFTYVLAGLTVYSAYILLKKLIINVPNKYTALRLRGWRDTFNKRHFKSFLFSDNSNRFILFGIALVISLLVYQTIIMYYHPIYSEYDSIYKFLPISKSILLGNGLNHDFYLGSDVNMRHPPFIQAINAWLIHSFEYSSVRLFPFYYVFLAAIVVYSLTRNIFLNTADKNNASFFGLIASSVFLITPSLLVVSSRFSLQQDIGFIFMLTASFYLLSDIIRYDKPAKTALLILSASLALMALTREIGLVIAVVIFFLVPAIKYTAGNLKIRAVFTVLSLLPFYILSFKDFTELGFTFATTVRIVVLLLINLAIYYLAYQQKNQIIFSSLILPVSNLKYMAPIVIPIIFVTLNMSTIDGPFPVFTFSGEFTKLLPAHREIFGISNPLTANIYQTLEKLPRIDILFISLAMGSIFIFLKLIGLGKIIYHIKANNQYSLLLIFLLLLLFTWSFLLQSRFQTSDIRYVAYFVPLLSIILVLGMNIRKVSSPSTKIFSYGFIVLATFYILHFNLFNWNYDEHFGGYWIEPVLRSIISWQDVTLAAIVIGGFLILEVGKEEFSPMINKYKLQRYSSVVLIVLICIQVHTLNNSGIQLASLAILDQKPPHNWETNVIDVINYLNNSEKGNVLSIRAPAIPFFTNRTNFDIFSPQTFAYTTSSVLLTANTSNFNKKIVDLGIRYIVIPNEKNRLYYLVKNSTLESKLVSMIDNNDDFFKIPLKDYNIYEYNQRIEK
jgi:hypothetical protein